jgi:hypothetical protein
MAYCSTTLNIQTRLSREPNFKRWLGRAGTKATINGDLTSKAVPDAFVKMYSDGLEQYKASA